jgi:uncharacterized protein (UPF0332 family)
MPPEDWKEFLAKAKECLRSAHSASERNLNNCAANRSYYAAYLVELAALEKFAPLNLTEWRHPVVINSFNYRLIRKKEAI